MPDNDAVSIMVLIGIRWIRAGPQRGIIRTGLLGLISCITILVTLDLALIEVLIAVEQTIVACYNNKNRK